MPHKGPSLQIGIFVTAILLGLSASEDDSDHYAQLVQQLRDGIGAGQRYLQDNREQIQAFFNSLNVEEGLDVEKWVKRTHESTEGSGGSSPKKKAGDQMTGLRLMTRLLELKEKWDRGQLDYGEVSRVLQDSVEFLSSSPEYGRIILNYVLTSNPALRQKSDELVNKLLPLLLDALAQGSPEAIFDRKVLPPTVHILLELFLSESARRTVSPLVEPSIDLARNLIHVLGRWHENATLASKRSELPDVADVFEAVVAADVRQLGRLVDRLNDAARTLRGLPAPKNPVDRRRSDTLEEALSDAARQARHLKAALRNHGADVMEASLRAVPPLRRLVQEVKGGAARHLEQRDAELHRELRDVGAAVERHSRRLASFEKLVHDSRNFNSVFDVAIVARDLLEVIEGVPKLEPIAVPFRTIVNHLAGIQEIAVDD